MSKDAESVPGLPIGVIGALGGDVELSEALPARYEFVAARTPHEDVMRPPNECAPYATAEDDNGIAIEFVSGEVRGETRG